MRRRRAMMMNVEDGQYNFNFLNNVLPFSTTLTRASTGWYFDSAGVLQSAANDVARFNYNPSTLALEGLLVEPARTNSIRNNTMVGAIAGTPGTAPTNWNVSSSLNNVTREIVGAGTEDGINYIDVRYSGTPNLTTSGNIFPENIVGIAAAAGQVWNFRSFGRLVSGSLTNVAFLSQLREINGGGSTVAFSNLSITPTSAALRTQQFNQTRTLSDGTTAFVSGNINFAYTNGLAIDFTLRFGLSQAEQGSAASSPIKTSSAAVTRSADVLSLALPNGTYDIDITRASGVTNVLGAVVSGGAYTVPTDLSPLQSVVARRVA